MNRTGNNGKGKSHFPLRIDCLTAEIVPDFLGTFLRGLFVDSNDGRASAERYRVVVDKIKTGQISAAVFVDAYHKYLRGDLVESNGDRYYQAVALALQSFDNHRQKPVGAVDEWLDGGGDDF